MLKDRDEAARLLLKKLLKYKGRNPLVVGIPEAYVQKAADEFIVLEEPEFFYAVSQFFEDFSQVTDDEVTRIFEKNRVPAPRPGTGGADVVIG